MKELNKERRTLRNRKIVSLYEDDKWSISEIAREFGLSFTGAKNVLNLCNVSMRPASTPRKPVIEIVRLRAQGLHWKDIGDRLGLKPNGACARFKAVGATDQNVKRINGFKQSRLDAYENAIDKDKLSHQDAMEIALEFPNEDS